VVTAAVIELEDGRVLIAKRKHTSSLAAKWEFPGGKVEVGETLEECLTREIHEELGIQISPPRRFFMTDYQYLTFDIRLCALKTKIGSGELNPRDHEEVMWVTPSQLLTMDLAPADIGIARELGTRRSMV
jgi:mutator protein MutT